MGLFRKRASAHDRTSNGFSNGNHNEKSSTLPTHQTDGNAVARHINSEGESGRRGINPLKFLKICWRGSCAASKLLNILWPFVPISLALNFATPDKTILVFVFLYIAMLPAASLLGFAGQEFARKLPRVAGVAVEITFGSVVEIIVFMILISKNTVHSAIVVKAAILGSILTNILLCLGLCFFVGGLKRKEQEFHGAISEVGSGLLLVAGLALIIPSAFFYTLQGVAYAPGQEPASGEFYSMAALIKDTTQVSRGTAIVLFLGFALFVVYNLKSHDTIFDEILAGDEAKDDDRHRDLHKEKLTMTECVVAIVISIALVSVLAYYLIKEIEPLVEDYGVSENFMGLILVPLVEKAAEHLTAIDEAWDNQMNFALFHCIGPSIQTAFFSAPLVIFVSWGCNLKAIDLNFEIFQVALLVLAIIVVGNFLRDQKSNYLEGGLLVLIYVLVAVTAWHYPNPTLTSTNFAGDSSSLGESSGE